MTDFRKPVSFQQGFMQTQHKCQSIYIYICTSWGNTSQCYVNFGTCIITKRVKSIWKEHIFWKAVCCWFWLNLPYCTGVFFHVLCVRTALLDNKKLVGHNKGITYRLGAPVASCPPESLSKVDVFIQEWEIYLRTWQIPVMGEYVWNYMFLEELIRSVCLNIHDYPFPLLLIWAFCHLGTSSPFYVYFLILITFICLWVQKMTLSHCTAFPFCMNDAQSVALYTYCFSLGLSFISWKWPIAEKICRLMQFGQICVRPVKS